MNQTVTKEDVYTRVNNRLVADLEQGVRPWSKPWSASHLTGSPALTRRANGEPYRGVNVLLLRGGAGRWPRATPSSFG